MDEFKILNKSKILFKYVEEYVCINIPKVYKVYREGLINNIIDLNRNIIKANINTGSIRKKYQKEVLVDISMIDLYLDILVHSGCINKKRFIKSITMLNEIKKMVIGLIESEKNKQFIQ